MLTFVITTAILLILWLKAKTVYQNVSDKEQPVDFVESNQDKVTIKKKSKFEKCGLLNVNLEIDLYIYEQKLPSLRLFSW